ncbi:DUF6371 domain-containing protein [Polaribacter sp. M15]
MYKKLKKIALNLEFKKKRNLKLITPCCSKPNKDGKYINYKGLRECYGYCHSCGKTTLPPTQYSDENGSIYKWDELQKKFIPSVLQSSYKSVGQLTDNATFKRHTGMESVGVKQKYIEYQLVRLFLKVQPQNNLLQYIGKTYGEDNKEFVKNLYQLGTSKDGGIIFWSINKQQKVQKAKVVYYNKEGKRKQRFKVPYKNEDGYYNCLFGEHLLGLPTYKNKPIILVESEKTAVICAINLPKFNWLSYGGINGLTDTKLEVLRGKDIILVPDMSENAVSIMNNKLSLLSELGINAKIWDMTKGKTDDQLKEEGWYNSDLEDFLRNVV